MTDPSSFGTALWTLLIVSAAVVALGLAAVSDMAMRRREDRAARAAQHDGPATATAPAAAPTAPSAHAAPDAQPSPGGAHRR